MKLIFLDFDGVVNTVIFEKDEPEPKYCYPWDGKVNNYQAVRWLNKLCLETGAKIVVCSSWRTDNNYKSCLYNGGLENKIEIIGRTPSIPDLHRGAEIQQWLDENKELNIESFVILDDESDMEPFMDRLVKCDSEWGFGLSKYEEAKAKLK